MNKKLKAEFTALFAATFMFAVIHNDMKCNDLYTLYGEDIKIHAVGAVNSIDIEKAVFDRNERKTKSFDTYGIICKIEEPSYEAVRSDYVCYEAYNSANSYTAASGVLTASGGVNYNANGNKETYYNLDMGGVISNAHNMGIEGDYWIRDDGVKMLGDYVMVAACYDVYPKGSLVETSLGTGVVVDTGGFAASNPYQLDIAVSW